LRTVQDGLSGSEGGVLMRIYSGTCLVHQIIGLFTGLFGDQENFNINIDAGTK
jgi:hypothetical protein